MSETSSPIERRTLLRGVAITGAAVAGGAVLAGCGGDEKPVSKVLVATADVPEGGGVVLADQEIVVTQPTAGEYKAFSSICTHQGCPVADVEKGTINCDCHGSMFAIADGAVVAGPAPSPLPPVEVSVDGGDVVRA